MTDWNPSQYLQFGDERSRAAYDLASRIKLPQCKSIVDLGCGPGNSTAILRSLWPGATVVGIDQSLNMLEEAKRSSPTSIWRQASIATWQAEQPVDLLFANASLHWLSDHRELIQRLMQSVCDGGAFAFQIPSRKYTRVRELLYELASSMKWAERLAYIGEPLTMHEPAYYYDTFSHLARDLDIWETEYYHVMKNSDQIVDWLASAGMRPFLDALEDERMREDFLSDLKALACLEYKPQSNGMVLYPFQRTFVIAYR